MTNVIRVLRNALGQIPRKVRRFRRDEGGTVAMMMGLAAIPLIFSVGAGIDYGTANMAKSKLDAIADTAALSEWAHTPAPGMGESPTRPTS